MTELEDKFVKEAIGGINYGLRTRPGQYDTITQNVDLGVDIIVAAQFIFDSEKQQYGSLETNKEAMERIKARIRQAIFDLTMSQ